VLAFSRVLVIGEGSACKEMIKGIRRDYRVVIEEREIPRPCPGYHSESPLFIAADSIKFIHEDIPEKLIELGKRWDEAPDLTVESLRDKAAEEAAK